MKIEITDIGEGAATSACAALDKAGFDFDKDYTCLYGANWRITGLQFSNRAAAICVLHHLEAK